MLLWILLVEMVNAFIIITLSNTSNTTDLIMVLILDDGNQQLNRQEVLNERMNHHRLFVLTTARNSH